MTACHIARTADTQDRKCHRVKPEGTKTPKLFLIKSTVVIESPTLSVNVLLRYAVDLGETSEVL
jgi:hypothetical protein